MSDAATSDQPMPLAGIRIVEYGVFHAGPGACAILGDLGADIIKIESGEGDPERFWTKIGKLNLAKPDGQSFMFEISNRNKRGLHLDIKKEKGREILHRLVAGADVFLTNLRKTTKEKMGLDYPTLARINPRIIHASVSGYGPEGDLADLGAFDPLGLARSGMMFVTGSAQPRLLHLGVLDQATAIAASHAMITALLTRERYGFGQEVHISLYSTAIWLSYCNMMLNNCLNVDPTTSGERQWHSPLRNVFLCQDGRWIIGTHHPEEKYWPVFCEVTGQTQLLSDPRFADDKSRQANCPELVAIFDEVFATRTRDQWMELFVPRGLMFSPIQSIPEIQNDPQALTNNYMVPFDYPFLGPVTIPGYPATFSRSSAGTTTPAPGLGQHTDDILREVGYSELEIQALRTDGIVR